jgi:hypothetical protein
MAWADGVGRLKAVRRTALRVGLLVAAGCGSASTAATVASTTTSVRVPATVATTTTTTAARTTTIPLASPTIPTTVPASARFVVTPTVVRIGDKITLSGTACTAAGAVVLAWLQTGTNITGTRAEITPHRDGTWSTTSDVADATMLGSSPAMATCSAGSNHEALFSYRPVPVQVSTFRTLQVTPAAVRPGGKFHIVASAGCPAAASTGPFVTLMHVADFPGGSGIEHAWAYVTITAGLRPWSTDLTVPAGVAPGRYKLSAYCTASRAVSAWYETAPVTVVAG